MSSMKLLVAVVLLSSTLISCTAAVNEGQENLAETGDQTMQEVDSSVEVLEDAFLTAAAKPSCRAVNSFRLVVTQNPKQPLYCLDETSLNPALSLGPLCPGGVTIAAMTADNQWRPCEEVRVCGKAADEVMDLVSRGPSRIRQFHFNKLPWGCIGHLRVSRQNGVLDPDGEMDLPINTTPPACPMCVTAGAPSCAACADDTNPPVITEVAVDTSICKKIKFAIFAEDRETDLHPLPYSFNGGATWTADNEIEYTSSSASLPANRVKVRDLSGNIATFAEARSGTTTNSCNCRHGSQLVANGASLTVYAESQPACNVACRGGRVTCADGVLTGDVGSFETACQAKACGCTAPGGQVIPAGESMELFKNSSVACGMQSSCTTVENRIRVSCTDAVNNVLTVTEGSGDVNDFRSSACQAMPCGCRHLGVEFRPTDPPLAVYKKDRAVAPEKCELTGMFGQVTCLAQGSGFRVTGDTNTSIYKYTTCQNVPQGDGGGTGASDFDVGPGSGGGSGGGLGNDDGEGEGFRRRNSGGGGGGGGCDVNKPPYFCLGYGLTMHTPMSFCYLPKADAYASIDSTNIQQRISPGGYIPAYSRATVTCGDRCSNYMGYIRCDHGVMSGRTTYPYLNCTEPCP